MARKRTKKQYANLFDNPRALFHGGPDDTGVSVTLWPNGEREIWLRDDNGRGGVRITASRGPVGMGIRISKFVGTGPLTVRAYGDDYSDATNAPSFDAREIDMVFYDQTEKAQAFKRWYDGERTADLAAILGPEYGPKVEG